MGTRATGIDVSSYQAHVNWPTVYASGVRFVGIKASEGRTHIDTQFETHRAGFRGCPFTLGVFYHFARPGDPKEQAALFLKTVGPLLDNERLALDFELALTLVPADSLAWIDTFFGELRKAYSDRRHLIYTSKRIWKSIGDPDWSGARNVDLWAPRYNSIGHEPEVPRPWSEWHIWQWTDGGLQETPGVGRCDANVFCGDNEALTAYAKLDEDLTPVVA
jgi:lysozyme